MPAGNAYPSGHLVPSPIVGLACAPIVETRFLELAISLLAFSPRIPLDTFSILLLHILRTFHVVGQIHHPQNDQNDGVLKRTDFTCTDKTTTMYNFSLLRFRVEEQIHHFNKPSECHLFYECNNVCFFSRIVEIMSVCKFWLENESKTEKIN